MNSLTRFVGYLVLLLVVLLVAAVFAQMWLHRQTRQLRGEAVEARQAQFEKALALTVGDRREFDAPYLRDLGQIVGATVERVPANAPPLHSPTGSVLAFDHVHDGQSLRVSFSAPPTTRLLQIHQRVAFGLLFALLFSLVLAGAGLLWGRRRDSDTGSRVPWSARRAEMGSLEHLAKTSVAQGAALDHERVVRRRAEEDALLRQQMLNRSLEEKIRLGRDLHDGIIQSLYAVGLTLESSQALATTDAAECARRVEHCVQALNGIIRDVRGYITGLAPDQLRRTSFTQALQELIEGLRAGRTVNFDLRVDDDVTMLLTPEQSAEALQIAREAISNALRHGQASAITIRLHQADREVCLLVQDNGAGFDATRRSEGHGLGNMRARAGALGADVRVESEPGAGTRVILTLPLFQSA